MNNSWRPRGLSLVAAALIAFVAAGVASADTSTSRATHAAQNPFAHYGKITLNVWSADNQDPGPKPVIVALANSFHTRYPNVTVKLKFYGLTDYLKIIQLALKGGSAPDVAEGNQGYGTDALLVKAKLIRPLDAYVKQYHWDKYFPPGAMAQFRWTPDGQTYGKGTVWGVGQFGQSTGIFYNKTALKKYGFDPDKMPTTFAGFDKLLAQLRPKVPSSQPLAVIGDPFGYNRSLSTGLVSGLGRTIQAPNGFPIANALQTDAALNPGNSGGPVLDAQGQVVGIADQIATGGSSADTSSGVGFAVPIDVVRGELSQLESGAQVSHAYLGISSGDATNGQGALVGAVQGGSPAAAAGLRRGDVITAIDGSPVHGSNDIVSAITSHRPGDRVSLSVRRGSSRLNIGATLATQPRQAPSG